MANPLSAIEICNTALMYIGSGYSIDSFEDEDPAGRACRLQYPQSRRDFLDNDHPFSFATTRKRLAKLTDFDNGYQLPADMIKPLSLADDSRSTYHIERDILYTDSGSPVLIYIQDSPDLTWFPPKAISAVQFILASKLAIILKSDEAKARSLQEMARQLIEEVAKSDIKNLEMPDFTMNESSLLGAR